MSDMVLMYHPQLPETQLPLGTPVKVALRSVDDHAARGWLLVDPGVTPPAPSTPYYPRAEADSKFLTEDAAREAFGLGATATDTAVASFVGTPGTETRAELDATFVAYGAIDPTPVDLGTKEFPGPVRFQTETTYTLLPADAGGLIIYDEGAPATYSLPVDVPAGWTVSVSQGFEGPLTVTAAGSAGPEGIRTPAGVVGAVTTKSSGSVLKFVKDASTRWFMLPYGDAYTVAP